MNPTERALRAIAEAISVLLCLKKEMSHKACEKGIDCKLQQHFVEEFTELFGSAARAKDALREWREICRATKIPAKYCEEMFNEGGTKRVLSFCMGGPSRSKEDRNTWIQMITERSASFKRGAPIYLDGFCFRKSTNPAKKYDAFHRGKKVASFGAIGYEQYKDAIGLYLADDHMDPSRRRNYFTRHGATAPRLTPKWFSHNYLW
jgi:hypothetical protein